MCLWNVDRSYFGVIWRKTSHYEAIYFSSLAWVSIHVLQITKSMCSIRVGTASSPLNGSYWPPQLWEIALLWIATNLKMIWSVYIHLGHRPSAWLTCSAAKPDYVHGLEYRLWVYSLPWLMSHLSHVVPISKRFHAESLFKVHSCIHVHFLWSTDTLVVSSCCLPTVMRLLWETDIKSCLSNFFANLSL